MTDQLERDENGYTRLQRATINIWGGIALLLSLGIMSAIAILVLAGLRTLADALLIAG